MFLRSPGVTGSGEPGELLVMARGQIRVARVALEGDPAAVANLREAVMGLN